MKTDPRCLCVSCFISKIEDVIDELPVNRTKLESIRMDFLNIIRYEKTTDNEFIDEDFKIIEMVEKIDCYADIEDIMFDIDMIKLYTDVSYKKHIKMSMFNVVAKGYQYPKSEDATRRIYEKLDNKKTIFDVKEIK